MSLICPICQDNLINGESTDNYVNKCGHVYHSACLLPWWDRLPEPNCPECRQPCNMDTITKIFLTVDHSEVKNTDQHQAATIGIGDSKTEALLRQIKEHIDVQTYSQTKDVNDKFRQQNSDFSTLLLNSSQRLATNHNDKLSAVSKELSEVISDEHKRLLSELGTQQQQPRPNISNSTKHSTDIQRSTLLRYCKSKVFVTYIAIMTALLCLITLIIVSVYSHLIFQAVKSTEHSEITYNVSQQLQRLSQELYEIADIVSSNNKNIQLDLENMRKSIENGVPSTHEILNRLDGIRRKEDEVLLEGIKTDRKVNLKLEILQNGINMLKAQIDAENSSNSQQDSNDQIKLRQLEEYNRQLDAKFKHLQTVLAQRGSLEADELRKQIENDNELSPQTGDTNRAWEEPMELWHKFTNAMGVKSSSVENTAKIAWVFGCTVSVLFIQIL